MRFIIHLVIDETNLIMINVIINRVKDVVHKIFLMNFPLCNMYMRLFRLKYNKENTGL